MQDMQLAPVSGHAQPAHPQAGNTSGKPRGQTSCASPLSARACEEAQTRTEHKEILQGCAARMDLM